MPRRSFELVPRLAAPFLLAALSACTLALDFDRFDARAATDGGAAAPQPVGDAGVDARPAALWVGDMETGDFSQYESDPTGNLDGDPLPAFPELVSAVADPVHVREGAFASRFVLSKGQKRQELVLPRGRDIVFREGDDLFFGFSVYLDPSWSADPNRFCHLAQWASAIDTRAPLVFAAEDDGFKFSGGYGHPAGPRDHARTVPGGLATGRWIDWVVRVKFSSDPALGFYEVYQDGALVLPRYLPPGGTLYPGGTGHHRHGLYAAPETLGRRIVWHDGWKIGLSYESVDPRYGR